MDAQPGATRRFVLVMTLDSLATRPLPEGAHLVVGRSRSADLRLDEPAASPRHLRITSIGSRLTVEDLGSLMGTTLNGVSLPVRKPVAVLPGEPISIGATVLMVREVIPEERPQHIWSHGTFGERAEEECERASSGGPGFSLLRVRLGDGGSGAGVDRPEVLATLAAFAPPPNAVGMYGPGEYEILLVNSDLEASEERAERLRAALGRAGCTVSLGLGQFPDDGAEADVLLGRANQRLRDEAAAPPGSFGRPHPVAQPLWLSPSRAQILELAGAHERPLWLLGPAGVGKETLARAIHARSPRAAGPFIVVEAGGRSSAEMGRILFGGGRNELGAFHHAAAGTLLIADADDLPRALLMRLALELHRRDAQSPRPRPSPRLILAGRRDPNANTKRGLAQGSAVVGARVHEVAGLDQERARLPALVEHLVESAAGGRGRSGLRLDDESLAWLEARAWPGNVRELDQIIDRAVANAEPDAERVTIALPSLGMGDFGDEPRGAVAEVVVQRAAIPAGSRGGERERILDALAACAFNQSRAAAKLGISRRTLLSRLDRLGIARPQKASPHH